MRSNRGGGSLFSKMLKRTQSSSPRTLLSPFVCEWSLSPINAFILAGISEELLHGSLDSVCRFIIGRYGNFHRFAPAIGTKLNRDFLHEFRPDVPINRFVHQNSRLHGSPLVSFLPMTTLIRFRSANSGFLTLRRNVVSRS
jgi:hypothetical protein